MSLFLCCFFQELFLLLSFLFFSIVLTLMTQSGVYCQAIVSKIRVLCDVCGFIGSSYYVPSLTNLFCSCYPHVVRLIRVDIEFFFYREDLLGKIFTHVIFTHILPFSFGCWILKFFLSFSFRFYRN